MCAKALVTLHCPQCVVPVDGPPPFVVPRGPPACPVRDGAVTGSGWVLAYSLVEQDGVPCWAVTIFFCEPVGLHEPGGCEGSQSQPALGGHRLGKATGCLFLTSGRPHEMVAVIQHPTLK